MIKSPTWLDEELMLALELYLSKDLTWLARISDRTPEIVTLSYILQKLDFHAEPKPEKFRSVGSVRMKLSNFKAVDPRYGKNSLSNIGKADREVYKKYSQQLPGLKQKCNKIVREHFVGTLREDVKQYISRFEDTLDEKTKPDAVGLFSEAREKILELIEWCRENNRLDIVNSCDELLSLFPEPKAAIKEYQEHAGINQERIASELKIGSLVRNEMERMIREGLLSDADYELLMNKDWCRSTFHLGHPLIKEINDQKPIKPQLRDENGYLRYWKNVYQLKDKSIVLCKEWFESNRKYFVSWVQKVTNPSYSEQMEYEIKMLANVLKFIQVIDSKRVNVSIFDIKEQFPDEENLEELIDKLLEKGVLAPYQGSLREFIVDDYELLNEMIQSPHKYIKGLIG